MYRRLCIRAAQYVSFYSLCDVNLHSEHCILNIVTSYNISTYILSVGAALSNLHHAVSSLAS